MITFSQLGNRGRLGNQLFQIATTVALAVRNNDRYVFPPWEHEKYFNLHNCFVSNINSRETFKENGFAYSSIPYKPNLNLSGFFRSEKYFQDCQDLIQNLLTPTIGFDIKWGCTAIHVRRGDYVHLSKEFALVGMDYYKMAMDIIKSERYMVFSDDIAWCKSRFIGNRFVFSEGKSPVEDLALRISCENNIIGNSTFSWWGAYLNKNPGKTIVAPKSWFGSALPHDTRDLLPMDWRRV